MHNSYRTLKHSKLKKHPIMNKSLSWTKRDYQVPLLPLWRYRGYDSVLHPWMDFNYDFMKYLNDIKHHKPRKVNGQPPSFINHWTAHVMWLTPRDHSLLGNNEPSRRCIQLSRAETVHNEITPVCNSQDPSPSSILIYLVKSVIEFFDLSV